MRRGLALSAAALVVLCCGCGAVAVPRAVWIDIGDRDQLRPGATELAHELREDGADVTFTCGLAHTPAPTGTRTSPST